MNTKQIGLSLLVFTAMVAGGFLVKYTGSFWIGSSLFLSVFLAVIIFGCGPWIDKVSLSMARAIKSGALSEAIRIGEKELYKETATTGVKLNLIAAYFNSKDTNKAKSIMEGIDVEKLSSTEKRVFDDWKKKINEA